MADFESDDDDDSPKPTAPPKHRRGHKKAVAAVQQRTTTPPPSEDGVVYDDDDLPKHHHPSISSELSGGWQSLMKKSHPKKPKLDPDVAVMQSLYSSDGALPTQYKVWSPGGATGGPASAPAADDLHSAAKAFMAADGAASFVQEALARRRLSQRRGRGGVRRAPAPRPASPDALLELAASASEAPRKTPDVLLEIAAASELQAREKSGAAAQASKAQAASAGAQAARGAGTADAAEGSFLSDAASVVLEEYAGVLHSKQLQHLARARLGRAKLAALWEKLHAMDPLLHPEVSASHSKKVQQAEQWCQYFQRNEQSAAPVHQAVAKLENATNQLAEAASRRSALVEEVDARTQLQKTVMQDVQSLTALLKVAREGQDTASLLQAGRGEAAAAGGVAGAAAELEALGSAAADLRAGHDELLDTLEAVMRKRGLVLEAYRTSLARLQREVADADRELAGKKAQVAKSQQGVEDARKHLAGIRASCEAALGALAKRRRAGHREVRAVEVALKMLGSQ